MRKRLRLAAIIFGVLLLMAVAGLVGMYWAVRQVPDFYRRARRIDPATQSEANDEILRRTTALVSDVKRKGRWEALFTAQQINAWLSVDLPKNHPDVLPPFVQDPRVAIAKDGITSACLVRRQGLDCVVSLTVEPYLHEPNVLAIRIRAVRAGLLPVPIAGVLDRLSEVASQMGFHVRWQHNGGDPVALISIPAPHNDNNTSVQLDSLRLGDGEIYVSGTTGRQEGE